MSKFALEITDLKKTYDSGAVALKGITLAVAEGDFFALLGPNGAGKSSTIGIIASLVTKSAGKVKILPQIGQLHTPAMILARRCTAIETGPAFCTGQLIHEALHCL